MRSATRLLPSLCLLSLVACGTDTKGLDPATAPAASVDRFSDTFATLFKRSSPAFDPAHVSAAIPAANAPIPMDNFLIHSIGPAGEKVEYYSLDIVAPVPQKAFQFTHEDGTAVAGQLPVLAGLPGDTGYSDYARITAVKVKSGYVANTLTSAAEVDAAVAAGTVTATQMDTVVNWAVVPKGTTANLKFLGKSPLGQTAWVNSQVASLLVFEENLKVTSDGKVPTVPIVVIFKNDMSPAAGFATEADGVQTHNVVGLLPGQMGYSSYWDHSVGHLSGFDGVHDLASAEANVAAKAPVIVNCPVVTP
jgi:hypothetical protein